MPDKSDNRIMEQLRRMVLLHDGGGQTDGKLLGCFIEERDGAAFEALMRRHGMMVLGVCGRILRNKQDVEDAFQSTFFVLVRKAKTVVPREMVGNWLYGVAQQTAIRTRAFWKTPSSPEPRNAGQRPARPRDGCSWRHERSAAPARSGIEPAAREISGSHCLMRSGRAERAGSWQTTRLAGRHSRIRAGWPGAEAMLAETPGQDNGIVFSVEAWLAITIAQNAASACMPPALVSTTAKAAMILAAGQTAATGLISAQVAAITKGVLTSMLLTKLKTAAAITLLVGALGVGVGTRFLVGQTPVGEPQATGRPGGQNAPTQPRREAQAPAQEAKEKPDQAKEPRQAGPNPFDIRLDKMEQQFQDLQMQNMNLREIIHSLEKELKARLPAGRRRERGDKDIPIKKPASG